ncbi:MAG: hypothetical protein QJR03_02165 [Sphaerobacter sp.]|nr:hypothetical protein [Sphaerobacter sp.]
MDIGYGDIFAARLDDLKPFPIATGPAAQGAAAIDGDIVVWWEDWDILGKNLVTGEEFLISETANGADNPAISGNWVVWRALGAETKIMARDIRARTEPITVVARPSLPGVSPRIPPRPSLTRPIIDGDRVVWGEDTGGRNRLLLWRIGREEIVTVAEGIIGSYDLNGDFLVYEALHYRPPSVDTTIHVVDLTTGETQAIATNAHAPTTDGRHVFWFENRLSSVGSDETHLVGYDLTVGGRMPFSIDSSRAGLSASDPPHARDGILVWAHGLSIQALATDGLGEGQAWRVFPETGYTVSLAWLDFWEHNGGLPVFGYPLSEVVLDPNDLQMQYFERQRIEHHDAHRGTPYEFLLGRLGFDDAHARGLLWTEPFAALPPDTGSDAHCEFFPQTGHRLCHGFKDYWHSHGLEFGDAGISFREALALFGYPISEEFTDPETGLTVQYFERARFEYHPHNPEPHTVLLGRLGADLLARE